MSKSDKDGFKKTTHLIAVAAPTEKKKEAAGRWRVPIVDPAWVIESVIRDWRQPETNFEFKVNFTSF